MQIILTEVRRGLRVFGASIHKHAFVYLLFPLVLGLLYGALYESFNATDVKLTQLDVYYHNQSTILVGLEGALARDLSYVRLIPANVNDLHSLTAENTNSIALHIDTDNQATIVNKHKHTLERLFFVRYMEHAVLALLESNQLVHQATITEIAPKPKMSSRANMLTSSFTGVSLFLVYTLTGAFLLSREKQITKRLMSIALQRWHLYTANVLCTFVISFVFSLGYFVVSYLLILKLDISVFALVPVVSIHSLFLASVYGLLIAVFHKARSFRAIFTPIIMLFMFLGGTIFPIDNFKGANILAAFTPNYLLKTIYEQVVLQGFSISPAVVTLTAISLVLLLGGAVQFAVKGEA